MRFSVLAVATALFGGVLASNVIDLDPSNFDSIIGQGKPALVELYVLPTHI
jgi:protein disulfide-isomerase A6